MNNSKDHPETKLREIVNEMSDISFSESPDKERFLELDEQALELLECSADPELWKQEIVNAHEFMNVALA